jgi:hypothetical protein
MKSLNLQVTTFCPLSLLLISLHLAPLRATISDMDNIISFDEVTGFLKNPPQVAPRPDFSKLRVLRQFVVKALSQLECPQSFIHGWAGLASAPHVYALLEVTPFAAPPDPGPTAMYTPFATPAAMKMINNAFVHDLNYFKSLKNIHGACFCMLDELVPNQFKVLNTSTLTGWNSTMSIHEILTQLEDEYGKLSSSALFATDNRFKSAFGANKAPELLFYRMEQCQEIMTLGKMPYTPEQFINNAFCLLMALNIFSMNNFDKWETQTIHIYPALKTFIHEAYTRHLNAMELCNTSGQMGYGAQPAQHKHNDATKDSAGAITVATIMAFATTGSTLGNTYATSNTHPGLSLAISAMIMPAFNQIAMNQTASPTSSQPCQ